MTSGTAMANLTQPWTAAKSITKLHPLAVVPSPLGSDLKAVQTGVFTDQTATLNWAQVEERALNCWICVKISKLD